MYCSGVMADTQFTRRKLSLGRRYRFQHSGIPQVPSFRVNRDTEADISRDDGGATFPSEEIHEEAKARLWIENSVLFISVDDTKCILRTNH